MLNHCEQEPNMKYQTFKLYFVFTQFLDCILLHLVTRLSCHVVCQIDSLKLPFGYLEVENIFFKPINANLSQ